ncbi:multicopper oxidase domain-containing protein [Mycolicibacter heraklionensis]|uniref:Copper-containing nitrite reductase n=1 Tax=Mycolicibacter heraklionensis TaxID=512402 RepID=A0A9X7WK61_9MYCO|nr:multicopper oxidase domain-containing protein [Mycolicibacter heraklionensis]QZA09132.1 multicopper oxidase domain-containing protein [Mycolicibacter heraklionensis]
MIQLGPPPAPVVKPRRRGGPRGPVFLGANIVVLGWLAVAVVLLAAHNVVAHPIWLPVHALLLGAATNAIVIWSGHFTTTLCRVPDPPQWHLVAKLALLNAAVIATLAGVAFNAEALSGAGGTAVAVVAVAHGAELIAMKKSALSARFDYLVGFYLAAIAALLAGSATGAAMAVGVARWYARLWTTHVHVMLYGWIGLTVMGTLFTLWPTTIREKITPRSFAMARRALPTLTAGLAAAAVGLLAGSWWLTAAGLLGYAVGVGLSIAGLWPGRSFTGPAAWMLVGATLWLGIAVVVETTRLIAARSVEVLPALVEHTLLPLLAVGFVAQILLGALSQLLPILVANGPPVRKAVIGYLDQGWQARVCAINLAVPLVAGPWREPLPLIGWALAAVAVASFVLLALRLAIPVALRGPLDIDAITPRPRAITGAVAVAAVAAVAVALGMGGPAPSGAAGVTGAARTIDVTLKDMRFSPDVIDVPAGTRLVLRVTNADGLPHDLHVDTGEHTPRLSRGQTAVLDLGAVQQDREAWCDVPGHRAAGMTMTIHAVGGVPRHQHTGGGQSGSSTPTVLDLAADPSPGWTPHDAVLAPAIPGVHRLELRAVDRELEIAPGRREIRWTFGGVEPAPTLHGRVGDTFEITLINDASMGHGIDFHAGALAPDQPMRTLAPGERLVYRFTAHRAGAWLYHCSTPPMTLHIANGMYGAVIIDPPGLPAVDREYALVGAQLYAGPPDSDAKTTAIRAGQPDGWMFNGTAAQYMHAPLPAHTGERVRVWVVNAGPGDAIAFHVVGTQFDTVYKEGAWLLRPPGGSGGSQALDLAPAQGGFVEMTFPEPGHYPFMDHDMRHAENGAHGIFEVSG